MRAPSCPHSASPSFQSVACCAAYSAGLSPALRASPSSIQGAKSSPRSSGKVSRRLERSPLGSMAIAGTWSIAASSSRLRQRPVLPLPVMPTQTACVTRSRES